MDSNSTEKKNKENGGNDNFKQPFAVPKKVVLAQVNDPNRTNSNTNAAASAQRAVKPVGSTQAKVFAPLDNLQASAVRPTSQTSQTRYPPSSNIDSRRSSGVFVKPASGFKSPDFPKAVVGSKPIFKDNRSAKSTPGGQANENARNPANAAPGTVTPPTKPKPKPIQKRHSDVPPLRTNEKSSSKDAREFKSFVFYFDPATVSDAEKNELIEQLGKLGARIENFMGKGVTHVIRRFQPGKENDAQKPHHIWAPNELRNRLARFFKPENIAAPVKKSLTQRFLEEKIHGPSTSRGAVDEKKYHYFKGRYLLCEEKSGNYKPILVKEYNKNDDATEQKPFPELYCERIILNRCPFNYHTATEEEIDSMVELERQRFDEVRRKDEERMERKRRTREKRLRRAQREFGNLQMCYFQSEAAMHAEEERIKTLRKKPPVHPPTGHSDNTLTEPERRATTVDNVSSVGPREQAPSGYRNSGTTMSRVLEAREQAAYKPQNRMIVELRKGGSNDPNKKRKPAPPVNPSERIMPAFMTKAGYCEHCCVKYEQFHEHVKSNLHQTYAKNNAVFRELDQLLEELARERKPLEPEEAEVAEEEEEEDYSDEDGSGSGGSGEQEDDWGENPEDDEDSEEDEGENDDDESDADVEIIEDPEDSDDFNDDELPSLPDRKPAQDSTAVEIGSPTFLRADPGDGSTAGEIKLPSMGLSSKSGRALPVSVGDRKRPSEDDLESDQVRKARKIDLNVKTASPRSVLFHTPGQRADDDDEIGLPTTKELGFGHSYTAHSAEPTPKGQNSQENRLSKMEHSYTLHSPRQEPRSRAKSGSPHPDHVGYSKHWTGSNLGTPGSKLRKEISSSEETVDDDDEEEEEGVEEPAAGQVAAIES